MELLSAFAVNALNINYRTAGAQKHYLANGRVNAVASLGPQMGGRPSLYSEEPFLHSEDMIVPHDKQKVYSEQQTKRKRLLCCCECGANAPYLFLLF